MLTTIKNKLISLLQLILVMIYILFEELIWEGIAKPIYEAIHSLKILYKIELKLKDANAYLVLFIFVLLLLIVEGFGIYAGILFVSGQVALGLMLYIAKIPVAGFTFWLFRVSEDKLMEFSWFKKLYNWMLGAIEWLKSREVYKQTMQKLKVVKEAIKDTFSALKRKYFAKQSTFMQRVKDLYKVLKNVLKKK